jgi:CRP-like cAMP-binding protein
MTTAAFFDGLPEQAQADFRSAATLQRAPAGSTLFFEGQVPESVAIVLAGRLKVTSSAQSGKEVILGFRGPGDLVGEIGVIDRLPRSATVRSIDDTELLLIAASRFRELLARHPDAAWLVLEMLTERLRDADRKRLEFGAGDTVGRLAARIVEMGERYGEQTDAGTQIALPLSQEELADWIGSSREAVTKALQTLRECGWVTTGRRQITITDLGALRDRAIR